MRDFYAVSIRSDLRSTVVDYTPSSQSKSCNVAFAQVTDVTATKLQVTLDETQKAQNLNLKNEGDDRMFWRNETDFYV